MPGCHSRSCHVMSCHVMSCLDDNEIAQSEACFESKQWINHFWHNGHLHIKGNSHVCCSLLSECDMMLRSCYVMSFTLRSQNVKITQKFHYHQRIITTSYWK